MIRYHQEKKEDRLKNNFYICIVINVELNLKMITLVLVILVAVRIVANVQ